ncbi:MAG: hypothetical protein KGP10_03920 [Actinomycetales bacterium]|nr:hypothetical protein [Actinomycetales bacterium]
MGKIAVENVNVPGHTTQIDAEKYHAMKTALLTITPDEAPGLTAAEMIEQVTRILPGELWPGGAKVGWWQKTVQLDLEAKGMLKRDATSKPMRWYRA